MASLQELIAQKEALERQIDETREKERSEAITKVRALMEDYGLSAADVSSKSTGKSTGKTSFKPRAGKGNKVAAKYRDTATGDSWSGRGLQPKWLKAALAGGRKLGDFAV